MSSVGQAVGAVVGGTIGFMVGGPTGAVYGAQIGAGVGGVVDPPVVPGQRIGELAAQTAREGDPRAIVFGTPRPIGGNVIATTEPIIRKKRQKSGGKGGGGSEVENEEIYRTYAIGICEGPITGIRRIWRDGKLVYFSGNPAFAQNNAKFLQNVTLYNGAFDQMPSSVLESALGIDNVTPFRGTAYMVMNNENLTNTGGRIPQWNFEPVRSEGFVLTSLPYDVIDKDAMAITPSVTELTLKDLIVEQDAPPEYMAMTPGVESLIESRFGMGVEHVAITPGVTRLALPPEIANQDPEYVALSPGVTRLELQISYLDWDVEALAVTPAVTELTLT